jgi:tetratricopeptide (TPR) repeat protein
MMTKRIQIMLLAVVLLGLLGWLAATRWHKETPPVSATQNGSLPSPAPSVAGQRLKAAEWKVRVLPNDAGAHAELATAYMQKARETGDGKYYRRAEAACKTALELNPKNYAAIRLVSWIYSGQHRFPEAVTAARQALKLDPNDPWNYGTLGDALVELGEYQEATAAFQRMADLRPDVNAYTRAAHIRELFGDTEGAIEFMARAVRATTSRDREHSAWCRVQLGNLWFNSGRITEAETQYEAALKLFPDYHYALAGMGKVRVAQRRFDEGLSYYQNSIDFLPTQDAVAALADLLTYLKRPKEAARQYELFQMIDEINRANGVQPESHTALFYADHDRDLSGALRIARQHASQRHDVRTLDTLAWVLFKNGKHDEALAASRKALRLGTKDALAFFHLGMIQSKLGREKEAADAFKQALDINPYFHLRHAETARAALERPVLAAQTFVSPDGRGASQ